MVLHDDDGLTVRAHLQAGLNLVAEQALFWNLADIFAQSARYDPDKVWLEGYVKPGVSFRRGLSESDTLYGKVSGVWSGTLGTDAYDVGDTGRVTLEEAYLGVLSDSQHGLSIDLSAGARELKLGTGMLFANGGSSGFERGALKFGPRKAWELTGIGKAMYGGFTATGFYLDANEVPSNDSGTALAGGDLRHDGDDRSSVGLTYANVVESESAYPKAAPGGKGPPIIIPGITEYRTALDVNLQQALTGQKSNKHAMKDCAEEWNKITDKKGRDKQIEAIKATRKAWPTVLDKPTIMS